MCPHVSPTSAHISRKSACTPAPAGAQPVELASGVDALYLSGHGYLSKGFLALLEEDRMFADRASMPGPLPARSAHLRPRSPRLGQVPLLPRPRVGPYRLHHEQPAARRPDPAPGRVPPCGRARWRGATFRVLLRPFVEDSSSVWPRLDLFCGPRGWSCARRTGRRFVCRGNGCTTYEAGRHRAPASPSAQDATSTSAPASTTRRPRWTLKGTDWWGLSGASVTPAANRSGASSSRSGGPPSANSSCSAPTPCWPPSLALALLQHRMAHASPPDGGLQSLPLAARRAVAGRAVGLARARRHRAEVHPRAQAGAHRSAASCPPSSATS